MKNILGYLSRNIVSAVLVTILTGLTVTTSAAGTAKLLDSMNYTKPAVPEVRDVQTIEGGKKTITQSSTIKTSENKKEKSVNNITNTISPAPSSSVSNADQNNNTCIITLFGKQYNVFSLKSTHSGGDIFTCNSDMTSIYQGQHGNDVARMQKYLIASAGTTNSNNNGSSTGTGSSTSINYDDDDDREDINDSNEEEHIEKNEVKEMEYESDFYQINK